jgi:hypothetical protein
LVSLLLINQVMKWVVWVLQNKDLLFIEKLNEQTVDFGLTNGHEYNIIRNDAGQFYGYIIHQDEIEQLIRKVLKHPYILPSAIPQPMDSLCEDWRSVICLDINSLEKSKQILKDILENI